MIRSQLAIARFMLRSKNSLLMRYVWLLRVVRRASESAARMASVKGGLGLVCG